MILVTGGSGVMGRALISRLLQEGEEVRVYDRKPPPLLPVRSRAMEGVHARAVGNDGLRESLDVEFIPGDIRDRPRVEETVRGCDTVFHLAAKMPQARLDEQGFHAINVGGTVNVADACVRHKVRRLVFASTAEVYGPQAVTAPLDEDAPKLFTGHYSRNKFECEGLLADYRARHGLESASLRIPMVLGPGFYHEKSMLALLWMVRHGLPVPVTGPRMLISFVSSEDVAQALVLASRRPEAVGGVFNIAAPDCPRLGSFFREFVRAAGSPSRIIPIPDSVTAASIRLAKRLAVLSGDKVATTPSELVDFILVGGAYSIARARRVLGYAPRHTCLDAWLSVYRWYFGLPLREQMDVFFRQRV